MKSLTVAKTTTITTSIAAVFSVSSFLYGLSSHRFLFSYMGILSGITAAIVAPNSRLIGSLLEEKIKREIEVQVIDRENYQLGLLAGKEEAELFNRQQFADWENQLEKSHQQQVLEVEKRERDRAHSLISLEREKLQSLSTERDQVLADCENLKVFCDERLEELNTCQKELKISQQRVELLEAEREFIETEKQRLQTVKVERQREQAELLNLKDTVRIEKENIISEKLQIAENKGRVENLNTRLIEQGQLLSSVQQELKRQLEESARQMQEEYDNGFQAGVASANGQWGIEREKLLLQIERLRIRCGEKEAREALDKRLPELVDVLKNERKPFLIVGSQGSGKALASAAIAQSYAGEAGLLPFVLDISEGGSTDSTWHKLGIPNTCDARLFLKWMQCVVNQLDPDKDSLPFRNDRDKYDKAPAIVLIIDELMTCLDGLDKSEYEQFVNCLKAFETRGNKRKVFVGLLTQNEQIQNLNKVTNTGRLSNFYKIFLNDGLTSKCSKEMLDKSEDLRDYIEVYRENYKCAVLYQNAKGEVMKPCKHPSHWGNKIHQTLPSRVVEIKLDSASQWFPENVLTIYQSYLNS